MVTLTILAIIIGLAFAPNLRRIVFGTFSSVLTLLAGVLFLTWLTGSRSSSRRRW